MSRKVIVLPEAEKQLKIRVAWWRENRTDVPEQVKKGFEELKTQLAETPWIGVRYRRSRVPGVMRVNIEKTPYYVYYRRNKDDDVVILTVWSPVMGTEPTFRKGGE